MIEEIDYEDILKIIADNLQKIRTTEGLSQMVMAEKLKTVQSNYSKVEHGLRDIRLLSLYYLAADLGININWLLGLSNVKYDRSARVFHNKLLSKKINKPKRIKK